MKLSIERDTLLKPLQQISGVVERRQTLPVLANVLIQAKESGLRLTTTDLEVELVTEIPVAVENPGDATLPARKLLDISRSLPDDARIQIDVQGDKAEVRSGRSNFRLSVLPATDFPTVSELAGVQRFSVPQKDLKRLIERTGFAMAQQDVRYYLNGLMLELRPDRLRAVATDGHRLALSEIEAEPGVEEIQQVIVPRKGVQELARLLEGEGEAQVQIGSNHIRISTPQVCFTSKLIDGRFPDYERVMPQGGDKVVIADREELRQALSRASILSNEKYRGIRLALSGDCLHIQTDNSEHEEAREEIEVDYQGPDMEVGFNVSYLLDALSAIPGQKVRIRLTDSNSSCLIDDPADERSRYVVMPMRL